MREVAELMAVVPAPAVAVGVFTREAVLFEAVTGVADLTTGRPATADTWWDLASLTKTLVTLPEALATLDLDRPLGTQWTPARGTPVATATPRALLSHSSGLPATVPFFRTCRSRAEIVAAALATPRTEQHPVYSDLGYLLLGEAIRDLTGRSLPDLAAARTGLRFAPLLNPATPLPDPAGGPITPLPGPAAATENCAWRGRLIVGEVHDENAAAMGGVAGHAGAFGTLSLVLAAAQRWLSVDASHCEASNPAGERFGLGWWLPPTRGLGGPDPGPHSFGCSGFVGNRIWLEPDHDYGVVVLSNRIHPSRGDLSPFTSWWTTLLTTVAEDRRNPR